MAIYSCFLLIIWTACVTCADTEVAAKQDSLNVHDALVAKLAALETTTTQLAESVSHLKRENQNQALIIQELSDRLKLNVEIVADENDEVVPETTDRDEGSEHTLVQDNDKRIIAVQDDNHPINKGPAKRIVLGGNGPVAFFATIAQHDESNLGIRQGIIFDNVVTNLGNAFHPARGNFIAPYRGLYMFAATLAANDYNGDWLYVHYMKNGNMVAQMHSQSGDMTSHTILLELNPGDDIFLAFLGASGSAILGAHYSSFAGQLITTL